MEKPKQHLYIPFLKIDKEVDSDFNIWNPDQFRTGFTYNWNRGCWIIGDVVRQQENFPEYTQTNFIIVPDGTQFVVEVDPQLMADWHW